MFNLNFTVLALKSSIVKFAVVLPSVLIAYPIYHPFALSNGAVLILIIQLSLTTNSLDPVS